MHHKDHLFCTEEKIIKDQIKDQKELAE